LRELKSEAIGRGGE